MGTLHGRHACELHAVCDDVVDLAVAHALGQVGTEVGNAGIFICADRRAAAAINSMTGSALYPEMLSSLFQRHLVVGERIGTLTLTARNSKVPHGTGHTNFDCGRGR